MELVEADIKVPVYDDWRQIIVLPKGLPVEEQARIITELMRERR